LESGAPVVLAGDYNVMPTDLDVYAPERWIDDALFRPEVRDAYRRLVEQGWTDALRALHPGERIYTFWKYFRNAFARNAGLRINHLLLSPASSAAWSPPRSIGIFEAARGRAITRRFGSNLRKRKAGHRGGGASATPEWELAPPTISADLQQEDRKLRLKKREIPSNPRAWWRDSQRETRQVEDDLIGRALHQHKFHFPEVDGLRRNQPGRIFLKNDRLAFHEVK
jgi:hypothetical protein